MSRSNTCTLTLRLWSDTEIIRDLRLGVFDVLIGINLLREGIDVPEVSLVAILDADKEGFLRNERGLIQTIGRAARNSEGHVIMYADKITDSMRNAIDETERRRRIQQEYNKEHNITPKTIQKSVRDLISVSKKVAQEELNFKKDPESMNKEELTKLIADIQKKMQRAAADLNFEAAAEYRDQMLTIENNASGFIIRWKGNCLIKYRRVQIYENIREPQIHQDTRCE